MKFIRQLLCRHKWQPGWPEGEQRDVRAYRRVYGYGEILPFFCPKCDKTKLRMVKGRIAPVAKA